MEVLQEEQIIVSCLDEHKAEDIESIDVSEMSPFCARYVLATAGNVRALGALSNQVEEALEKNGLEVSIREGEPESGWMIVGGEDVIVHIFLEANRREIDLKKLVTSVIGKHA